MRPRRRCARTASPWGGDVPLDLELVFHQRTKLLEDLGGAGFPGQGRSPLGGLLGPGRGWGRRHRAQPADRQSVLDEDQDLTRLQSRQELGRPGRKIVKVELLLGPPL